MRTRLVAATAGLLLFGLSQPSFARDDQLQAVIGTLNAVLNPVDAQRYEELARRNRRVEEERYWHEYWYGLEEQRAERYRQEAQERRRWEEERYWRAYRAGLRDSYRDLHGTDEPSYRARRFDRYDRKTWGEDD